MVLLHCITMTKVKEDYKVDPLSIKVDQTKRDTRRDAWDRDYICLLYTSDAADD